ncbi:hypothetical protein P154DRAFT_525333 [Amniculicola lignicola CBS 123094]|uniref:C2H2-type domain-containing protein n=1 Tax=Amniculicola lignicola CBS 123094 TaxID=1392246 RepID=A0A6A5W7L4_9PLEO|nr:hypothetical protein P154DRAFT_525333 [Amniculicola lignicola CBS 123094]
MAVFCHRCQRSFRFQSDYDKHIRYSLAHHTCGSCGFDAPSWSDLLDHCRDTECYTVCQGCDDGLGELWDEDSEEYWEHVDEENVCVTCEQHFESEDNLRNHQLTHRSAGIKCLGWDCERSFTTYGGMILHLESSTCSSDITALSLNEAAARNYDWDEYIDDDYYQDLLDQEEPTNPYGSSEKALPFKCPICAKAFPKLSSLFMHAESKACEATIWSGVLWELREWLEGEL